MPSPCVKQESVYCFDDYYYLIENCVRNSPINFLIFFFVKCFQYIAFGIEETQMIMMIIVIVCNGCAMTNN